MDIEKVRLVVKNVEIPVLKLQLPQAAEKEMEKQGSLLTVKKDGTPFKGVRKEKSQFC